MRGPFSRPLPSSPQNALHSAVHATHLRACVLAQRLFVRRTVRGARAAGLSPVLDEHMQAITKLPVEGPNRLLARTALELYRALQHANQGRRHERVVALLEEALVSATRGGFAMAAASSFGSLDILEAELEAAAAALLGPGFDCALHRDAGCATLEVRRCEFADFNRANGASFLTPIFCRADDEFGRCLRGRGMRYSRPTTLHAGGRACMFTFESHARDQDRVCAPVQ